jgi:hypothetical protein
MQRTYTVPTCCTPNTRSPLWLMTSGCLEMTRTGRLMLKDGILNVQGRIPHIDSSWALDRIILIPTIHKMLIYNVHTLQKTFALTYIGQSSKSLSVNTARANTSREGIIRLALGPDNPQIRPTVYLHQRGQVRTRWRTSLRVQRRKIQLGRRYAIYFVVSDAH